MNQNLNALWRRLPLGPRFLLSLLTSCTLLPLLYLAEQIGNEADLATWHTPAALFFALASALAFHFTLERIKRTLDRAPLQ